MRIVYAGFLFFRVEITKWKEEGIVKVITDGTEKHICNSSICELWCDALKVLTGSCNNAFDKHSNL